MRRIVTLLAGLLVTISLSGQSQDIQAGATKLRFSITGGRSGEKEVSRTSRSVNYSYIGVIRKSANLVVDAIPLGCFDVGADPLTNDMVVTMTAVRSDKIRTIGADVNGTGTVVPEVMETRRAKYGTKPAPISTGMYIPADAEISAVNVHISYTSHSWNIEGWLPFSVSIDAVYYVLSGKQYIKTKLKPYAEPGGNKSSQASAGDGEDEGKKDVCPVCGGKRTSMRFKNFAGTVRFGCSQDPDHMKTLTFKQLLRRPAIYEGDVILTDLAFVNLIDDETKDRYQICNQTALSFFREGENDYDEKFMVAEHLSPDAEYSMGDGLLINLKRNQERRDEGFSSPLKMFLTGQRYEGMDPNIIAGSTGNPRGGGIRGSIVHFGFGATTVLVGEAMVYAHGDTLTARSGERIVYDDVNGDRLVPIDVPTEAAKLGVPMEDIEHHYDEDYVDIGMCLPDGMAWAGEEADSEVAAAVLLIGDPDASDGIAAERPDLAGTVGVEVPALETSDVQEVSGDFSAEPEPDSRSDEDEEVPLWILIGGGALLVLLIVLLIVVLSRPRRRWSVPAVPAPKAVASPAPAAAPAALDPTAPADTASRPVAPSIPSPAAQSAPAPPVPAAEDASSQAAPACRFCPCCGSPVANPTAKFCRHCGQPLR